MAFSVAQISQARRDAYDNDGLVFLGANQLSDNALTPAFYNTGGQTASSDLSDPTYPPELMWDYDMSTGARATSTSTIWYVNMAFNTPITFDSFAITFSSIIQSSITLTVTCGNVADFTSGSGTAYTATLTNTNRVVISGLDHVEGGHTGNDRQYDNLEWLRFEFNMGTISQAPHITEIWAGQRIQFSRCFADGVDDAPRGSDFRELVAVNRNASRYTNAWGFADQSFTYIADNPGAFALDDITTFRTLQTECQAGARPVWFRTKDGNWALVRFTDSDFSAPIPQGRASARTWQPSLAEKPPFAARES